jgi:hypothetical protein
MVVHHSLTRPSSLENHETKAIDSVTQQPNTSHVRTNKCILPRLWVYERRVCLTLQGLRRRKLHDCQCNNPYNTLRMQ